MINLISKKYQALTLLVHKFIFDKTSLLGGLELTIPGKLVCGGTAGAIAQSFSYPLDVTRRRMQLSMMNPETHKYR